MSTSETITRTDLTNILNEVLPVQAGLRTTGVTSGNISLTIIKSGGIVQIFSFGSFPATNDGVTIVTIPEGFRPKQTTDYTVFDVDGVRLGTLRFFSDGRVVPTFGNLKAGNVRACWTYISSADYIPADADVVVEQGTSGIWTYRKWNSGIAECWGYKSINTTFVSWGSLYYIQAVADNYPTGLFTTVTNVQGQLTLANADTISSIVGGTSDTTKPPSITGVRPTNATSTYAGVAYWNAKGTWK